MEIQETELIEMAIRGYEIMRRSTEKRIADLKTRLNAATCFAETPTRKRKLFTETRRRMAAAQKKRWAKARRAPAHA